MQDAYASYVKDNFLGGSNAGVQTYDREHLKRTDLDESSSGNVFLLMSLFSIK